ncbi:hypothetical protein [Streptomyces sp. NBC_00286]|uniref:hypothetical protein n=1 Tax=Streptomyces sp. NBC_00286 TaxID=2975701 RepID=UPI002E2C04CD|nr:hypothetical protein [Streptomyces sp. NBC_00286]
MTGLDTYAIPESQDPAYASGAGDLSVHEVATSGVRPDLAYFAYCAGGFRVTKIKNDKLVEVGRFIDEGGNNFWGCRPSTPSARSTSRPPTATSGCTSSSTRVTELI